ncbi:MAG: hypothetical protein QXX95_07640 [Nitrososphaerales archaeon]
MEVRKEILRLLKEDEEFKYTVAGYLGISEILKRLDRIDEHIDKLWESHNKLWESHNKLWESHNKLWEEVRDMRLTLNRLATTLDRLTISEEEALSFIKHRIINEIGIDISLDRIFVDSKDINIYGVSSDLCVIGEATVRLGVGLIDELVEKVKFIKSKRPDLLRDKLIKVIYTDYSTPAALNKAKEKGVWVLKWSGDLTPRVVEKIDIS